MKFSFQSNDVWIAALALRHGLILVTRDAHFQEVESLQTVAWYKLDNDYAVERGVTVSILLQWLEWLNQG